MATVTNPRTAAAAASTAVVLFVVALIALALFFGGAGAFFGPINDVTIALSLALTIPAIAVVVQRTRPVSGSWFAGLGVLAVAGIVLAAAGQLLLVAGVVPLATTFITFGLGALPYVAWILAHGILARRRGIPSPRVGSWALAFIALVVIALALGPFLPVSAAVLTILLGGPVTVAYVGWLAALGAWLRRIPASTGAAAA